jgi:hypothetical protein
MYGGTIRVARFFLGHDAKTGKNVPNAHKISQICKIFQMVKKYIHIFQSKALLNLPKLGFLV